MCIASYSCLSAIKYQLVPVGSSSGIGAATSILFSKFGARVVLAGRNVAALEKTSKQCIENSKSNLEVGGSKSTVLYNDAHCAKENIPEQDI